MKTRRQFLKYTLFFAAMTASGAFPRQNGGVFAASALAPNAQNRREFLVVCDSPVHVHFTDDPGQIAMTDPGSLRVLDIANGKNLSIDLPFLGHTATQNPQRPGQAVIFEKWGLRGALVDIQTQTILATANPIQDNIFFGHAAFNADGGSLVTSEDNYERSDGQLVVRDAQTMKILSRFFSYGTRPHECRSLDDGKTLLSVNTGSEKGRGSVVWIEWASGKLLNKVEFDATAHGHYAHIDCSYDHWMCICSAVNPNKGKIAFISPNGQVLVPELPPELIAKMPGQALSIAFLGQTGLVAVTLEDAGMVYIMDYKTQKLVGVAYMNFPNGVVASADTTVEEPRFIVSLGKARGLVAVAMPKEKDPIITPIYETFGGTGAHLTRMFI